MVGRWQAAALGVTLLTAVWWAQPHASQAAPATASRHRAGASLRRSSRKTAHGSQSELLRQLQRARASMINRNRWVAQFGAELWPPPPCPDEGMVQRGRFCVDRYEAHLVVEGPDHRWQQHPHYLRPPSHQRYMARSAAGVYPQGYISRVEAQRACHNAGKRLCTWLEWRRACQGPHWRRYPYGNRGKRGRCNTGKEHLLHKFFGKKGWKYDEHFNSPRLNQEPGFLAKSGAYEQCQTEAGVFDMAGNLHEWVSTMVTESFVERMEAEDIERLEQPWVVGNGMFLGGFYSTTDQHGAGCFYTTIAHEPNYHDYSTGFRCCSTAVRAEDVKKRRAAVQKKAAATDGAGDQGG